MLFGFSGSDIIDAFISQECKRVFFYVKVCFSLECYSKEGQSPFSVIKPSYNFTINM